MRAPFQILAIPYQWINGVPFYCVLHRSDCDQWQFIAGGGENQETTEEATKREIFEESGISVQDIICLKSMCHIPIVLSHEHTECVWLNYQDARKKLQWDSNKTALYKLNCRLSEQRSG